MRLRPYIDSRVPDHMLGHEFRTRVSHRQRRSKVLDGCFGNDGGRRCSQSDGGGGAKVELGWGGGAHGLSEVDEVLDAADVLVLEAADTEGEVDGPGAVDDEGCFG